MPKRRSADPPFAYETSSTIHMQAKRAPMARFEKRRARPYRAGKLSDAMTARAFNAPSGTEEMLTPRAARALHLIRVPSLRIRVPQPWRGAALHPVPFLHADGSGSRSFVAPPPRASVARFHRESAC